MLKYIVKEFYDSIISNFLGIESDDDGAESTMNHTQHNR